MKSFSFGPMSNDDGSPTEATKAFARSNHAYFFAWIQIPQHVEFPQQMIQYDGCEFADEHNELVAKTVNCTHEFRTVVVRKPQTVKKSWTPGRWENFNCKCFPLSDRTAFGPGKPKRRSNSIPNSD